MVTTQITKEDGATRCASTMAVASKVVRGGLHRTRPSQPLRRRSRRWQPTAPSTLGVRRLWEEPGQLGYPSARATRPSRHTVTILVPVVLLQPWQPMAPSPGGEGRRVPRGLPRALSGSASRTTGTTIGPRHHLLHHHRRVTHLHRHLHHLRRHTHRSSLHLPHPHRRP